VNRVLAVTGLSREAKIVAGPGVVALASGGEITTLAARIETALSPDIAGIISIGIAGALDPSLKVGQVVIAADAYRPWANRMSAALPGARLGFIVGSDTMLVDAASKAALHRATGALAVDMESHVARDIAARYGLPFAAVRVISDDADRALPKAAQAGMKPDGGMDIGAVLKSLAADPRQLPALIRTGMEAETAFRALTLACRQLGPGLGFRAA
jgi:hopanoid-associated phosphorylase